ncbi:MAG: hypothetical protein Fur0018_09230 [Anaerolineales bacterium]
MHQGTVEFLRYLAQIPAQSPDDPSRLPSLQEMSAEMKISVSKLREHLEVARALGLVDVRPRLGIRRIPFSFTPAVRLSLVYGVHLNRQHFDQYADVRDKLERAYWHQAVSLLTPEDHRYLQGLVAQALHKLNGVPVRIPHDEHRELHMAIYSKLDNSFVHGLLAAFWDAYESFGLNLYADYDYLQRVWRYHGEMVDAIQAGDFERGLQALIAHKDLLHHRPA